MKRFTTILLFCAFTFVCCSSVWAAPLRLAASADSFQAEAPVIIHFSCKATGGIPPYSYDWNFHDLDSYKNPASGPQPGHLFTVPGRYEVEVNVKDADGSRSTTVLPINIELGGETFNAVNYLEMYNDGKTDNGMRLADFLQSMPDRKIIIEFPAGTYLFRKTQFFSKPAAVTFRPLPADAKVALLFAPVNPADNKTDYLFEPAMPSGGIIYIHNLTLQRKLKSVSPCDLDSALTFGRNRSILALKKCTVRNFTTVADSLVHYFRNNILGWGCFNNPGEKRAIAIYAQGNSLIEQNYIKSNFAHSHVIYTGADRPYVYIVGNYLDGSNMYKAKHVLNFYATKGRVVEHKYAFRNIIKNPSGHCVSMEGQETSIDPRHIHIVGNIFDGCPNGIYITAVSDDILVERNQFQNIRHYIATVGERKHAPVAGVLFIHNTFGAGAGADTRSPGKDAFNYLAKRCRDTPDACGVWKPNRDDESLVDTADPGPREFLPPRFASPPGAVKNSNNTVTISISCQDNGSGMGPKPRWPEYYGGLVQFSSDNRTWSETRPYSAVTSWLPLDRHSDKVFSRCRDRDGNWNVPMAAIIQTP